MKKAFTVAMTVFYLAAISGVSLNLHFCGKQLYAFSFFGKENAESNRKMPCCSVTTAKTSCCHFHTINIKVKDSHDAASPVSFFTGVAAVVPLPVTISFASLQGDSPLFFTDRPFPPLPDKQPVYLLNRTLLV